MALSPTPELGTGKMQSFRAGESSEAAGRTGGSEESLVVDEAGVVQADVGALLPVTRTPEAPRPLQDEEESEAARRSDGDDGGGGDCQEEYPESVHHAAYVYWLDDETASWPTKIFWMAISCTLACVQCYVMQGAADHLNPMHTDCEEMGNDACPESTFCMPDRAHNATHYKCVFCGFLDTFEVDVEALCTDYPEYPACEARTCIREAGSFFDSAYVWDDLTAQGLFNENLDLMEKPDYVMLALCAFLVSIEVYKDTRECYISTLYARQYAVGFCRMLPLHFLQILRQFVMIPQAISLVPMLTVWQGASAIDVAMNALATVFILEVDNVIFEHVLPERIREDVTTKGVVTIDQQRFHELSVCKYSNIVLVTLAIIWGVLGARTRDGTWFYGFDAVPTYDANWKMYVHDQLLPRANSAETIGGISRAALAAVGLSGLLQAVSRDTSRRRARALIKATVGIVIGVAVLQGLLVGTLSLSPSVPPRPPPLSQISQCLHTFQS